MFTKGENQYTSVKKLIDREINRRIVSLPKGTVTFANHYSFAGGSVSSGNGGGFNADGTLPALVYGAAGAEVGVTTLISRSKLEGKGGIYLKDNATDDEVEVHVSPIMHPLFYLPWS